jgi:hypothetical protein
VQLLTLGESPDRELATNKAYKDRFRIYDCINGLHDGIQGIEHMLPYVEEVAKTLVM